MALTDNLTGYYQFASGALTTDGSGSNHTLTNNDTVAESASGIIGYCADQGTRPNTTKFFNIANDSLGNTSGAFSMQVWVKINTDLQNGQTGYAGMQTFVASVDTTSDIFYFIDYNMLGTSSPSVRFVCNKYSTGENNAVWASGFLGTTNWYHFVGVHEATGLVKLFHNGTKIEGASFTGNGSSAPETSFNIGALPYAWANGGEHNCAKSAALIDEVAVWNRALTDEEVTTLYNSGSGYDMLGGGTSSTSLFGFLGNGIIPYLR